MSAFASLVKEAAEREKAKNNGEIPRKASSSSPPSQSPAPRTPKRRASHDPSPLRKGGVKASPSNSHVNTPTTEDYFAFAQRSNSGDDTATHDQERPLRGPFSRLDSSRGEKLLSSPSRSSSADRAYSHRKSGSKPSLLGRLNSVLQPQDEEHIPTISESPRETTPTAEEFAQPEAQPSRPQHVQAQSRWDALRNKLGVHTQPKEENKESELQKGLTGHELVTDLTTGMLSIMMLKMSFDRDEHGSHRVPVLLNYLKLRITDSVYPFHNAHAIFRIELEYGDGLLKWVIYRELRDFVNLHAHYRVSSLRHNLDNFPAFPKTSLPFYNKLKRDREKEGKEVGKREFARLQRLALEDYLLKLIRSLMFRPEANRLCKFLELSALSLHLSTKGGITGKQGYLRIMNSGASRKKLPGFHPLAFKYRHEPKWFMVRDSYVVSVDEADSTNIWDVFLFDSDFEIERPKRLYKQGLSIFSSDEKRQKEEREDKEVMEEYNHPPADDHESQHNNGVGDPADPSTTNMAKHDPQSLRDASNHTFYLKSSERKLKLVAKNERQMDQFIASIQKMAERSPWAAKNRFSSFAPIRVNASAQWLVDGRDYFWNLSRAILLAKERIYIHDWWLSPELYLRRPAAQNGKWRLDRLLKQKAEEGVQIFIIIYKEVSNDFTPVESIYTKNSLLALHPNIHVQRSPSHGSTKTLLWSHHEKMCVIDETIGFMGGLDLCFGRWDTPGHVLVDDSAPVPDDVDRSAEPNNNGSNSGHSQQSEEGQMWPGKDYSNSRVSDFYGLDKPFEDMYDRNQVVRQPWHDIGLQIIGQPARDLGRHFVQRWNLLLRTKNHSRIMPFLLPPPDFTTAELEKLQITGTCEAQICRSAGPWSIGTPSKTEHSIQTAYVKAIQLSDHFVYIENQFFITSTVVQGTTIENNIGNALVDRIIRAHREGTKWRAIIIIPLVPGYPMPLDHPDAGSVRLIMECQNLSMSRGPHSIFARLRHEGIDPDNYISFYSLRGWGKLKDGMLGSQDIYIHAKAMIVDDRIAIIGSANINERSQRGDRDSELACIIRDTDMIDSTMAGEPYQVGRFAHTLRVRLMREHIGIDVDALEEEEMNMDLLGRDAQEHEDDIEVWDPEDEQGEKGDLDVHKGHLRQPFFDATSGVAKGAAKVIRGAGEVVKLGVDKAASGVSTGVADTVDKAIGSKAAQEDEARRDEEIGDKIARGDADGEGFASTVVPTIEEKVMSEKRPKGESSKKVSPAEREHNKDVNEGKGYPKTEPPHATKDHTLHKGSKDMDNHDIPPDKSAEMQSPATDDTRKLGEDHMESSTTTSPSRRASTSNEGTTSTAATSEGMDDDLAPQGEPTDIQHARPRDESPSKHDMAPGGRHRGHPHAKEQGKETRTNEQAANSNKVTGTIRRGLKGKMKASTIPVEKPKVDPHGLADPLADAFYKDVWMSIAVRNTQIYRKVFRYVPDDLVTTWSMLSEWRKWSDRHHKVPVAGQSVDLNNGPGSGPQPDEEVGPAHTRESSTTQQDKKSNDNAFTHAEIDTMEELLGEVTGHLVLYPTRFLEAESAGKNFLWSKDRIPPISIYD